MTRSTSFFALFLLSVLRFFLEYQWLVDFAVYTAGVFIFTECYYSSVDASTEVNIGAIWCVLTVLFSLYPSSDSSWQINMYVSIRFAITTNWRECTFCTAVEACRCQLICCSLPISLIFISLLFKFWTCRLGSFTPHTEHACFTHSIATHTYCRSVSAWVKRT